MQPKKRVPRKLSERSWLSPNLYICSLFIVTFLLVWSCNAIAQSPLTLEERLDSLETDSQSLKVIIDTIWVVFAGTLVFFMNAGFAMVETGFCRQKNAVNLLSKNLIVFAISTISFWAIGFGLMFGDGNMFYGEQGFFLSPPDNSPLTGEDYNGVFTSLSWVGIPLQAKFFFQLVFAGTAATIVSGAVAERTRFGAFILFSFLLVSFSYAITGHWIWGGGWLSNLNFQDFAGSTTVHSVGGWAGLAGTLILGPRLGKYEDDNSSDRQKISSLEGRSFSGRRITAIPGHNLSLSTLGCLILWLGWFGFNPGSTMSADPLEITHVLLTTNLAAAAGGLTATLTSWLHFGKPDLSFLINGILAGLVAITAACAFVSLTSAIVIGLVAGITVVSLAIALDKFEIDDPVGAISVHLGCGLWGTIAVGLFSVGANVYPWYGEDFGPAKGLLFGGGFQQILTQATGILAVGLFTVLFSSTVWFIIQSSIGLRVSEDEEIEGLDLSEHSMSAHEYEIDEDLQ